MDYEERLRGDLEGTITEHRGEDGAVELARLVLERDTSIYTLVGLQYNCSQAIYGRRGALMRKPVSIDLFDVRERRADDEKQFYNREETREYVLDEEWSWLHPRYRWLVSDW